MPDKNTTSGFGQFAAEMRRRHVVRFALGYAAAAFVVLQLAEIVFPAFGMGEGALRLLVVAVGLGFPPALVLAWVYDITTEGIKRTTDGDQTSPVLPRLAVGGLLIATIGVTGALGAYLAEQGVFEPTAGAVPDGPTVPPVQTVAYEPGTPIRSIAVLPLDDFSPGSDQAYFASGMHEEIIAKMSLLDGIRVVSRRSVMQYAGTTMPMSQIGQELDVDVVVEGSVTRTSDRTRVTLRIVHAESESDIGTLQWDREEVEDVLAFQTEVAHMVVHELDSDHEETLFANTVATVEPAAQEAYFKGKYQYELGTDEGYRSAFDHFETALEADPDFAPAMAGMAGARFLIGLDGPDTSEEDFAQARREAQAAIAMDSTSMEALEVLAFIERSMPRVMGELALIPAPESVPKTMHVIRIPGESDSIMVDVGAFDTTWVTAVTSLGERIEEQVRLKTMNLENQSLRRETFQARQFMSSGRYGEATDVLESIVEDDPQASMAWEMLARTHVTSGDPERAVSVIETWHDTGASGAPDADRLAGLYTAVEQDGSQGYWSWQLDRLESMEAEGLPVPPSEIAAAHAALGNADQAFAYMFEALEQGDAGVLSLRSDPVWDDLRMDLRFRELGRQAQVMRFSPTRRSPRGGRGR
jgi:TolB-like protein